ncbi:MAG TPA: threonine ammonia-lyase [Thalassobaculum sp.]
MPIPVDLDSIRDAAAIIRGAVVRTPTVESPSLSLLLGCRLSLKLETQQHTNSFKERGAVVKLSGLDSAARRQGVIAMSAGNHAQGVAYHAARLGIPATIVMPETTPFSKVERTRSHGARVVLRGRTLADCRAETERLVTDEGLVQIHPYDDLDIIRGQGTVGLEMLQDEPDIDTLLVPIGGGGLISGIAIAAKALNPDIRILGVQVESFPSMHHALRGLPAPPGGSTLAEGIAVKDPGRLTRTVVSELVEDIVLVPERAIERAVQVLIEQQRLVVEGAGAAGIAALMHEPGRYAGRRVATVICGGNIDSRILASVMMRGLVRDGRIVRLRVEIPDEPGVLATVARVIGETGGNIVEIYHQRLFQDVPIKQAELDAVVETRNAAHVREIVARFAELGMPARLLATSAVDGEVI